MIDNLKTNEINIENNISDVSESTKDIDANTSMKKKKDIGGTMDSFDYFPFEKKILNTNNNTL